MAALLDIREMKVPNGLVLWGLVAVLIFKLISFKPQLLIQYFTGAFVPILLLFILFALGMLGAGDIKLFALIGASLGPGKVMIIIGISFVFGAVFSLITMITRHNLNARMLYFWRWLNFSVRQREFIPYYLEGESLDGMICFSTSILLGFVTYWGWTIVKTCTLFM